MAVDVMIADESAIAVPDAFSDGSAVGLLRTRVEFAGTHVDQIDLATAMQRIERFLLSPRCHQIATVNLDFLSIAAHNPDFRDVLNRADLAVADGMPLVWVSRLKGQALPERVTGNELVAECCQLAAATGRGVFLLGAAKGVGEAAAAKLRARSPGLRIAGVYSPPFGPLTRKENERIIRMVNAAQPGFLFVALGAPRQDVWIAQNRHQLNVPIAMGVGCVLDLLAGNLRRAPQWMQRGGLEWAYRMFQEPRRLWRRYIMDDIPVLGQLVWDALRQQDERLPVVPAAAGNQST